MARYALFLRAVNVGGRNLVAMAALRKLIEREGFGDVQTLLQSGNAVFSGVRSTPAQLEKLFEDKLARGLEVETDCFIRTATEWAAAVRGNPFSSEAKRDPGHLLLVTLKAAPTAASVAALTAAIPGRERVSCSGRHLYAVYPDGTGRSKLNMPFVEKHLRTRGTGRNWNTVLKVAALLGA